MYQQQLTNKLFLRQKKSGLLRKILCSAVPVLYRYYLMVLSVSDLFDHHIRIVRSMLVLICRTPKCFVSHINHFAAIQHLILNAFS